MAQNSQIAFAPLGNTVVIPAAAAASTGVQALVLASMMRPSVTRAATAVQRMMEALRFMDGGGGVGHGAGGTRLPALRTRKSSPG